MIRRIAIQAALILALAAPMCPAEQEITLDDFIGTAIENNPRYRITAEEYLIALYSDRSAQSIGDLNLIASALWTESYPSPLSYFTSYQNTVGYSVGLEKLFPETGTSVKLEQGTLKTRSETAAIPGFPSFPDEAYTSNITLSIVQPLMKDAFGLITKKSLEISSRSRELAEIKLTEDWEDFIAYLTDEYRRWQLCHTNVELYRNKLKRVESQLYLVERQRKLGLSEELDLIQIRQKFQGYKLMLEQAKMDCETQSKRVKRVIGREDNTEELVPDEFESNGTVPPEEIAMSYLNAKSNIKSTADLLVRIQKTNFEMKENETLPELTLVMEANPNSYADNLDDSYTEIGTYRDYTVSLNASRPLFNDAADAERDRAREEYEKAMDERKDIMLQSQIGLEGLYINLKYLDTMLKLNEHDLELAEERLRLEKEKYDQGRNTIFFVLQAEDDLLEAENRKNGTLFARESVINQIKLFTDQYALDYSDVISTEGI